MMISFSGAKVATSGEGRAPSVVGDVRTSVDELGW
jgi:hypothetical protein